MIASTKRAGASSATVRARTVVAFLSVLVASLLVAAFILQQIAAHAAYPFDLDEANHANGALALLLGFNADGFAGLLREFFRQGFYPPAFALVRLLGLAAVDLSATTVRIFSVLALFFGVLVIYAICLELDKERGWLAGPIACGATLTVQPLLINSALVMEEAPGLLVSFLFLWVYLRTFGRSTPRRLALASALLLLVFLTKYTYGLATLATAVLLELSWTAGILPARSGHPARGPTAGVPARLLWLFAPFLLGILIWFAYPGNVRQFLDYVTAQPEEAYLLTLETLLFYPRSIALAQSPAPIFALLTALALLWSLTRWRNVAVRLLLIYFLVGLAMMTLNRPQNPRFIATFVPAAHILTGLMVARMADEPLGNGRTGASRSARTPRTAATARGRIAGLAVVLAIIALSVPNVVERFKRYPVAVNAAYETDPRLNDLARWLQAQIPDGRRFYLVNYWDHFGPQTMAWSLGKEALARDIDGNFSDMLMPGALLSPATPQATQELRQDILQSGVSYVVVLEGSPWGSPFWPEYTAALQDRLVVEGENTVNVGGGVEIKVIVYGLEKGD